MTNFEISISSGMTSVKSLIKSGYFPWIVVGLIVATLFTGLYFTGATELEYYSLAWIFIIIFALWFGNRLITILLDRRFAWLEYGNLRFFAQLIIGSLYTLLIINISYFAIKLSLTEDPPTLEQIIVSNVYGTVIFIPVYSIYFSMQFLKHWRKSELASERFQKESIRSQLESLKNHLDPHFLFNNLNILSSLIDKDKQLSQQFLENFGDVYRIMLKTKSNDLIPLHDELEFIKAYIFLIKTRFGENIIFDVAVNAEFQQLRLPPLTLQLLIENAIKHNSINEKRPLKIHVSAAPNQYLIVTNSLFEKESARINSNGTGLTTIRKRYQYFTDKEVIIKKSESDFSVEVPLLEIESL